MADSRIESILQLKKKKMIQYCNRLRKKEMSLKNLKDIITGIKYVLKYMKAHPNEFRNVFRHWILLVKDIFKEVPEYSVSLFEKISLFFLYVVRFDYKPITLIEDILTDWVELLINIPVNVTEQVVLRNSDKMVVFLNIFKNMGHYKYEAYTVEILIRYLFTVGDEKRNAIVNKIFIKPELIKSKHCLNELQLSSMEEGVRSFVNAFNESCGEARLVHSFQAECIRIGEEDIHPPSGIIKWVDFNLKSSCISFYGDSKSDLSTLFEIHQGNVKSVSENLKIELKLWIIQVRLIDQIYIEFSEDDEDQKHFEEDREVTFEFRYDNEDIVAFRRNTFDEFLRDILKQQQVQRTQEVAVAENKDESLATLNFTVNSFNSKSLVSENIMLDEEIMLQKPVIEEKKQNDETVTKNSKKRRLYTQDEFDEDLTNTNISAIEKSLSELNDTYKEEPPKVAKRVFRKEPPQRVPVYRKSAGKNDEENVDLQSVYSNQHSERNTTTKKTSEKRKPGPKKGSTYKRPSVKKPKLNLKKTTRRSLTKTKALEAKRMLNLSRTPTYSEDYDYVLDNRNEASTSFMEKNSTLNSLHASNQRFNFLSSVKGDWEVKSFLNEYMNKKTIVDELNANLRRDIEMEKGQREDYKCDEYNLILKDFDKLSKNQVDFWKDVKKMQTKIGSSFNLEPSQKIQLYNKLFQLVARV